VTGSKVDTDSSGVAFDGAVGLFSGAVYPGDQIALSGGIRRDPGAVGKHAGAGNRSDVARNQLDKTAILS